MKQSKITKTLIGKSGKDILKLVDNKSKSVTNVEFIEPQGKVESWLSEAWSTLIGTGPYGRDHDFFHSGGNSLKAIHLLSLIAREFGVQLELNDVFLHPTVASLSKEIERKVKTGSRLPLAKDRTTGQSGALSYSQERLWFIDRLEGSTPYHIPAVLQLDGKLDLDCLEKAFRLTIGRHEVLRTTIYERDGLPVTGLLEPGKWYLKAIQAEHYSPGEIDDQVKAFIAAPFDLSADFMIRVSVFHTGSDSCILAINMHHIASDAWSLNILLNEVRNTYENLLSGQHIPSEKGSIQYADYALWQREFLSGDAYTEKLGYWKSKLSGVEPLNWITDLSRPKILGKNGRLHRFVIDPVLYKGLKNLAREQNVTLYMTLLAVYDVLLSRYSLQDDICVGTSIANRSDNGVNELIGYFVNTLAIRNTVDDSLPFSGFLNSVKNTLLEAYQHQEIPFEQVVDAVSPDRDLSRSPLFQTMLVLHELPEIDNQYLGGARISELDFEPATAMFDMTLFFRETGQGLEGSVEYNTDLFEERTIRSMLDHFTGLLRSVIKDPEEVIGKLPMAEQSEIDKVLIEFNEAGRVEASPGNIVFNFETVVENFPEHTAVVHGTTSWSYQRLNSEANRIAHRLLEQGINPGDRIAVCLNEGPAMLAALLGILKSGAAYVPIDPEYPAERSGFMMEDSGARFALTVSSVSSIPEAYQHKVLFIDDPGIDGYPDHNPGKSISPDSPAYVIYTSGSTGVPKGVLVSHFNVSRLFFNDAPVLRFTENDVWTMYHSYCFDFSVWEMYGALLFGGKLVMVDRETAKDPSAFARLLENEKVTVLNQTPSAFYALQDFLTETRHPVSVDKVIFGGEALNPARLKPWKAVYPECVLINMYGITETTVHVTFRELSPADLESSASVIGKPIPTLSVYILDRFNNPVPAGLPGEIVVGGAGVSLGYLNREELTREKFISDPYQKTKGARMYRSGDLGRWTLDGTLEYLGRLDEQVKIRGYRIEPGEIERTILNSQMVRACVVISKIDPSGSRSLIAYFTPLGETTSNEIADYLNRFLPDYMVPQYWVDLKEIPLTPNGKVDKKALPLPDWTGGDTLLFEGPKNEVEEYLLTTWSAILGVERISVLQDFFRIGGNSLLSMRLLAAIRKRYDVVVSVRDLFLNPTIRALGKLITEQSGQAGLPAITPQPRRNFIALSYAQERLWFIDHLEGTLAYHVYNLLWLKGTLDSDRLERAIREVVNRHEVLRTVITGQDDMAGQRIRDKDHFELIRISLDWADQTYDHWKEYVLNLVNKPFDLTQDNMLRAHLLKTGDQSHILVLTMHHMASDAWSLRLLMEEVSALYNAGPEVLPELPVQYADYAIWQRRYMTGEWYDTRLNYWTGKLTGVEPLDLPADFTRPVTGSSQGATHRFTLPASLVSGIKQLAASRGATVYMTMLAGFKALLGRHSRQWDICVGTSIANRTHHETERLIGYFVNTLALRTTFGPEVPFTGLLDLVKSTVTEAYDHQDIPFEKVVDAVVTERDTSRSPLFQVMLVLQEIPDISEIMLKDLEVSAFEAEQCFSKFDLTFFIREKGGEILCTVEYSTDLFRHDTIVSLSEHYVNILGSAVSHPSEPVFRLSITGDHEDRLLREAFQSEVALPEANSILDLFEAQASSNPGAVALMVDGNELTYEDLARRVRQIAGALVEAGIRRGSMVPVCIDSGTDKIAGLLGIMKAGAAYVPFEQDLPATRLAHILSETDPACILCSAGAESSIQEALAQNRKESAKLIKVEEIQNATEHPVLLDVKPQPDLPAYVIYTSGSTGNPKGVVVEHGNLLDYVAGFRKASQSGELKSYGLVSSVSTDLGNTALFGALTSGATLHVFSRDQGSDVQWMHNYFDSHAVDCLKIVPSHWKALELDGQPLCARKLMVFGGEALRPAHVEQLLRYSPQVQIINHYGPTETTVGKLLHRVDPGRTYGKTIPIGHPFGNTRIYILDDAGQACGLGVPGQLYISGKGVAKGYLNQPELNRKQFITDPETGERMYATGDLVRTMGDGEVEFLGRVDEQVKIRGYRVELSEIERSLNENPDIERSVVLAREDHLGNKKLMAWVVCPAGFNKESVITTLRARLPEYMIPGVFVPIDRIPLTANGKIDRKALPDPDRSDESKTQEDMAPRSAMESTLAEIWAELLDRDSVGIHDNFFELGGDSIISIQMVSRARKAGYDLQIGDVFTYQTIARLSDLFDQREGTSASSSAEQFELTGACAMLPIQKWFFDKNPEDISWFNQSVVLGIDRTIDEQALRRAVEQITEHHDSLRFKYFFKDDIWKQSYSEQVSWEIISADLGQESEATYDKQFLLLADKCQAGLDIEKGEILKVLWVKTPAFIQDNRLLIVIHHLAVDGVSWRIILSDLETILTGILKGEKVSLGAKTASYRQWAGAMDTMAGSPALDLQRSFWYNVVRDVEPLPYDLEGPHYVKASDYKQVECKLDQETTRIMVQEIPAVYHTGVDDLLAAALVKTISAKTGKAVVHLGLEGHGREQITPPLDLSRTVGWFTTHYPVRIDLSGETESAGIIRSVKEQLRSVPQKGLGFGILKYNEKDEVIGHAAYPDIVLNYLGQTDQLFEGKTIRLVPDPTGKDRSPSYPSTEKINIACLVRNGELQVFWNYSTLHFREEKAAEWAEAFVSNLSDLIGQGLKEATPGGFADPSDYGLGPEINYRELDAFLKEVSEGKPVKEQVEAIYPLSGLQHGILFHSLYDEIGYVNQFWCDLIDPDTAAVQKALDLVFSKHRILSSSFYYDAFEIPVQVVGRNINHPVEEVDLRSVRKEDRETALREFAETDRKKGFDLRRSPLMRITLIRQDDSRFTLLWTAHHILFDGWSRFVMIGEFLKVYDALVKNTPVPELPEDRYRDYIHYLQTLDPSHGQAYWKNYLEGIEEGTLIPFIRSKTGRTKGVGTYEIKRFVVSSAIQKRSEAFAQSGRLTMNSLLQGVWAYLLHRYTDKQDIVFGVTVSGRPDDLPAVEQRVGLYINTIPLRSVISDTLTVAGWLDMLQKEQVRSRENQYTPLQDIQKWLDIKGELFDSLFVFDNYPVDSAIAGNAWSLRMENVRVFEQANYPLNIVVTQGGTLNLEFMYNTDLLSEVYVQDIFDHFERVLDQMTATPDLLLKDIQLLSDRERQKLLKEFNKAPEFLIPELLPSAFMRWVIQTPDAVALRHKNELLTYRELNQWAVSIATELVNLGVGKGHMVPVGAGRSFEMIASILGIIKTGAAFVPVDPDLPAERLEFILRDISASVLIPGPEQVDKMSFAGIRTLDPGRKHHLNREGNWAAEPVVSHLAEDLAYIIYTSGSTGHPKGVLVEHGNLANYLLNPDTSYIDKGTQHSGSFIHLPFTFDASITGTFMPLIHGKQVVISSMNGTEVFHDENLHRFAPYDFIKLTPAHFEILGDHFRTPDGKPVTDRFVVGGEALYRSHFDHLANKEFAIKIINEYGPTEATVGCTTFTLDLSAPLPGNVSAIPIGKPIHQTQIFIVNEQMQLVPHGIPGEICIGGAGVARGYLNLPDLSHERFIYLPGLEDEYGKVYRTGDTGYWTPDGNLEFIGRRDDQLKIRGYRIEPGEIESWLNTLEGIRGARVMARETASGSDERLVAYVQVDREKYPLLYNYQRVLSGKMADRSDLHMLPDGLPVLNSNLNEVRFLYQEIFEDHCYLKNGITLGRNATVIDVGANAGFFNIFLSAISKDITVYAFEPIPEVYRYLKANRELYQVKGKAFNLAVLDRETEIDFNYFPDVTIVSGISDDRVKVKEVVRSYIENSSDEALLPEEMESLLEAKLESRRIVCKTRSLSQVIAQEQIGRIDLLKIDVENSEHFVINGLNDADWDKIDNLIVEVHDLDGRLDYISGLLEKKGYTVIIEKEEMLSKDDILYNLFALKRRNEEGVSELGDLDVQRAKEWKHPSEFALELRKQAESHLPGYMVPNHFILVDEFPLTKSGKLDKRALPAIEEGEALQTQHVAAANEAEQQLVRIWTELLELEEVGTHDDFFEIGGHSLLAIRLISAIRKDMKVDLDINEVFDYPTISQLVERINIRSGVLALPEINHADTQKEIPLSYSQERMWFIDKLEGSVQYHVPTVLELRGDLNVPALRESFVRIIGRHEVLRTIITEEDGRPMQTVISPELWNLTIVDGDGFANDQKARDQFIREHTLRPFLLSHDYMVRATLVRFAPDHHLLLITLHHIASDGWSIPIMVREFMEVYAALTEGREPGLVPLQTQYSDYAAWQRANISGTYLDEKLSYWKERLLDVEPLNLPTDFPRPLTSSVRGSRIKFRVEKDIADKLEKLSRDQGTTLFMTLFTGFNVLMNRYSGQDDLCIGTPVANRNQKEVEPLIGYFINTLALRTDLSGNPLFSSLLQQVRKDALEAFAHQEVPFEKVVEAVVKERDLNRNPLYQVLFSMQNTPEIPALKLRDIEITPIETGHETSQLDLICNVTLTRDGIEGSVEYCTDLFREQTVVSMMSNFRQLLKRIAEHPSLPIGNYSLVDDQELKEIRSVRKSITGEAPLIISLFERTVSRMKDHSAVVFNDQILSFDTLNRGANKIAHALIQRGINRGSLVPLLMDRGPEMVMSILGILKAGAAFVPVDPDNPAERVRYILGDTGANLVLINTKTDAIPEGLQGINPLSEILTDPDRPDHDLHMDISGTDLAYVIYTSGTTGVPKGVMVEHGNLAFYLSQALKEYVEQGTPDSGSYLHLSYAFDAALTALFLPLLAGKVIVLAHGKGLDVFQDPNLRAYAPYDFIKLTPAHLELIKPYMGFDTGHLLTRRLVLGGEALNGTQVRNFAEGGHDLTMINEYGPTEATVGCTIYHFNTKDPLESGPVPIGVPMDGVHILLLGNYMEPVPTGVPGDIYIGGPGVARGYLHQEALTKERFIEDPLQTGNGHVYYKTGDIARQLEDGNLEFLGRRDEQVKIHGYRVELAEIENRILGTGMVRSCVVSVREEGSGNRQLVGYVIPDTGYDRDEMSRLLQTGLPDYMVPRLWVEMNQFPLTINGKINRKALPAPVITAVSDQGYMAPTDPVEEKLVGIWAEVLGLESVGIHDNFFDLGGDSIIIIQIVSRARKEGLEFQINDIFTHQTIARLAAHHREHAHERQDALAIEEVSGVSGLLPIQQWFFDHKHAFQSHYNQSIFLQVNREVDPDLIHRSLECLVHNHDALRFEYHFFNGQWIQKYEKAEDYFHTEDLGSCDTTNYPEALLKLSDQYQRSLDIEEGKMLSAVYIKTPDHVEGNRLLIIIHHLAVDGVSWRILIDDFLSVFTEIRQGRSPHLPAKTSSYQAWASALRDYMNSPLLEQQSGLWKSVASQFQPLPVDHDFSGKLKFRDLVAVRNILNKDRTDRLLHHIPGKVAASVQDVLITALYHTLTEWTGRRDLVIGLEGHGREDSLLGKDSSRTVGWFTTLYPQRLCSPEGSDVQSVLRQIREQLKTVPDKGMGWGVFQYIDKKRRITTGPAWDVVFNYLGQTDPLMADHPSFKGADEAIAPNVNDENYIDERLLFSGMIRQGQLEFRLDFSGKHFAAETISRVSDRFSFHLNSLIDTLSSGDAPEHTVIPSDIGLSGDISVTGLDRFIERVKRDLPADRKISSIVKLSGLQQGILYHHLLAENSANYIVQFSATLNDPDLKLFRSAWDILLKRHSALRAGFFHDRLPVPVQVIFDPVSMPVTEVDLTKLEGKAQAGEMEKIVSDDLAKGFDIQQAPLMRVTLMKLDPGRYKMLWTFHHLIIDGWSMPVLMSGFLNIYEDLVHGRVPETGQVDRIEDYIRYLDQRNETAEEVFWKEYMQGLEEGSLLPFIQSEAGHNMGLGTYQTSFLNFDKKETLNLQEFAKSHRITMNTLVQGIWAMVLHHYTNSDHAVYGAVVSGRPGDLSGIEQRVGMYINTIPLHTRFNADTGVGEWLHELQGQQIKAREHQYTSLSDIQKWSGIQGDLFDSILVFENYPVHEVIASQKWALEVSDTEAWEQTNYPLTITVGLHGELTVRFRYNSSVLTGGQVDTICRHFKNIAGQIVSDGSLPVGKVRLMSPEEEAGILWEFSSSRVDYPAEKTIVDLFRETVGKYPEERAVSLDGQFLTYRQLDEWSSRLAALILDKTNGHAGLIPVCIDRRPEMLVAIFGILKAGGAYVPVDPSYPSGRITYMIQDTKARLVIIQSEMKQRQDGLQDVDFIELDPEYTCLKDIEPGQISAGSPDDPAYVIYTSGSTGKPKGVVVEHRALADHVFGVIESAGLQTCRSFALFAPLSFDAGHSLIFASMVLGADLHLISHELLADGEKLSAYLDREKVDCIKIVPSLWLTYAEEGYLVSGKQVIIFGGEAFQPIMLHYLRTLGYHGTVYNHYGPTETTIGKTIFKVDLTRDYTSVPIGRPFSNTRVYVLNRFGHHVPPGVTGELYIAGDGLARGYLNNPELTAEKFVPDTIIGEPGMKMYRTGDFVRWTPDGNLEYLGRKDEQVKIRGHRIETGEIENELNQSDMVRQAIVRAIRDGSGQIRLAAYIVPGQGYTQDALKEDVSIRLPDYMIPAVWMEIDAVPLMSNGKVDRNALPDLSDQINSRLYEQPSNQTEEKLLVIWKQVLKTEHAGVTDNFFELGGHSLLVIRLLSAIRREFRTEISITTFFELLTIRDLANYILVNQPLTESDSGDFDTFEL